MKDDGKSLTNHLLADQNKYNKRIKFIIFLIFVFEIIGTLFYHHYERWSYLDSLYFSTYTLTTVGYGNINPVTVIGKVFTIGYMILGVSTVLYGLSILAAHFIEQKEEEFIRAMSGATIRKPVRGLWDKIKELYNKIPEKEMYGKNKKRRNYRGK